MSESEVELIFGVDVEEVILVVLVCISVKKNKYMFMIILYKNYESRTYISYIDWYYQF